MRCVRTKGHHFSLGLDEFPSRLKATHRTIYRNMQPCFEQGFNVSAGYHPRLINIEKLQQPCISVIHLHPKSTHKRLLGRTVYREQIRHAAGLCRHTDTATQHLSPYVALDEQASINLSATNVRQDGNMTKATASWKYHS